MKQQATQSLFRLCALAAGAAVLAGAPVYGADALAICTSGQPFLWPNGGANIPFNPDQGDLREGIIDNAAGVALVQAAFDDWTAAGLYAVPTSATYTNAGPLPVDVDITNFGPYLNAPAPDGFSAIVFDANGQIFDLLFGANSGILGFAGPEWGIGAPTCSITEGLAFLNGPAFTDLTVAEDVMMHEFGHYSNLGHVELNGQLFPFGEGGDTSGPTPDDPFPFPGPFGTNVIESMYPFYFGSTSGTQSPHADDVASIATLYPGPTFFSSRGSISGTIFAPDGVTRLSGVNVIARNIADPMMDAVSTFSGAYTNSTSQADPNVGIFALNNLTPGAEYVLFVDEVTAAAGRFSNPILATLPGPEEYWNGANESSDPAIDDPLESVLIIPAAGSPFSADIIFNAPPPGVIPLGDDDFAEIFIGFPYTICGQTFNSVFVNSNGNLTFGSGDRDFSESIAEFLGDQPRIAGLWDDLNPSQGGAVSFSRAMNSFTVRFENVPEFFATGANTFEMTLHRSSDHVDIDYANISSPDGLAGVSCGGAITSGFEQEEDLTASAPSRLNLHNQPARYELFSFGTNDLEGQTVLFNGTTDYNDNWAEPNDNLGQARSIKLPFDSIPIPKFTEIEPTGDDVDYFRFDASAGTTLLLEIVGGELDTVIGLFDPAGNLIAVDDDGGAGLLSRIVFPISADGQYYLAVSTFPDFDFDGDGGSGGRYVLDASAVTGFVLDLGDDDFEEVPLGFTFPYQGSSYSSVFVNSNGNLTFGSGDTDFSESVSEFLNDQPRIAPLWDDLNPSQGGSVTVEFGAGSATVNFVDVPEFFSTGANNFSVTLAADGSVTIAYGSVTALDGIVGVTEGGGAADPGETDLSAGGPFLAVGTTYERFTGSSDPFDLDDQTLAFQP